jgi:hypothetical protein
VRRIVDRRTGFGPRLSITSPDVQKSARATKVLYKSEVAVFVAICPFARNVVNVATESGITSVHRPLLQEWRFRASWRNCRTVTKGPQPQRKVAAGGSCEAND